MKFLFRLDVFFDGQKIASFSAESITKKPPANKKVYGRFLVVFWADFGQMYFFINSLKNLRCSIFGILSSTPQTIAICWSRFSFWRLYFSSSCRSSTLSGKPLWPLTLFNSLFLWFGFFLKCLFYQKHNQFFCVWFLDIPERTIFKCAIFFELTIIVFAFFHYFILLLLIRIFVQFQPILIAFVIHQYITFGIYLSLV